MYPSDSRQRRYASGAFKRSEKKLKLETAVKSTQKIEQFFGGSKAIQSDVTDVEEKSAETHAANSDIDVIDIDMIAETELHVDENEVDEPKPVSTANIDLPIDQVFKLHQTTATYSIY